MPPRVRASWVARLLVYPRALYVALALGAVLAAPSVAMGLVMDDYVHVAIMMGVHALGTPNDLFTFADGHTSHLQPFIDTGPYPWWTYPQLKLSFFRPLSSQLIKLDWA